MADAPRVPARAARIPWLFPFWMLVDQGRIVCARQLSVKNRDGQLVPAGSAYRVIAGIHVLLAGGLPLGFFGLSCWGVLSSWRHEGGPWSSSVGLFWLACSMVIAFTLVPWVGLLAASRATSLLVRLLRLDWPPPK